jgi:transcriptional regulator with XRE-family HTH domain
MVMIISQQSASTPASHQVYARLFGRCIEKIRESRCQSLEDTAFLAGMESSEWAAIEAGHVPGDEAQLQSMAGALECHYDQIVRLAFVCKGAWGL